MCAVREVDRMISLSMDVEGIFSYMLRAGMATFGQLLLFMGPGLILVTAMSFLAGQVQRLAARSLGLGLYLGLFGWLGTSIHEIGHAIFHSLFGHHIVEFQPYKPDASGTLGYVKFTYNQNSLYQQIGMFFAAIGPILF